MGEWSEEARNHKIRRTAPPMDDHERPSSGPAKARRRSERPWKIEWRTHPKEAERQKRDGWWWNFWRDSSKWSNYGAYRTANARDQALGNLQRKNQDYWQYRAKDS